MMTAPDKPWRSPRALEHWRAPRHIGCGNTADRFQPKRRIESERIGNYAIVDCRDDKGTLVHRRFNGMDWFEWFDLGFSGGRAGHYCTPALIGWTRLCKATTGSFGKSAALTTFGRAGSPLVARSAAHRAAFWLAGRCKVHVRAADISLANVSWIGASGRAGPSQPLTCKPPRSDRLSRNRVIEPATI